MNIDATLFFLAEVTPTQWRDNPLTEAQWEDAIDLIDGVSVKLPFLPVIGWHIDISSFLWEWAEDFEESSPYRETVIRFLNHSPEFKIAHLSMTRHGLCVSLTNQSIYGPSLTD
jgi:hypothetical protein